MSTLSFRKYPSTTALQCFESSARHQSFTRAAKELYMTQSAVSKQVAQLEEMLKLSLFYRSAQGIVLTPAGKNYYKDTLEILKNLELATVNLMAHGDNVDTLKISCQPTLCARWLIPAIKGFGKEHPNIHLDIQEQMSNAIERDDAELVFLYGDGVWSGMTAHKLFDEHCIVVCSPDYLDSPISKISELAQYTLLQISSRPALWYHFFEAYNDVPINSFKGPRFSTHYACISAAKSGCGIALVPDRLVSHELTTGELIIATPQKLTTNKAYYMAYATTLGNTKRVKAMTTWIWSYLKQQES